MCWSILKYQPLVAEQQQQMSTYKTPTPDILIHTVNEWPHTRTHTHTYAHSCTKLQVHLGTHVRGYRYSECRRSGRFPRLVVVQYKNRFRYLRMHKTINLHSMFIASWLHKHGIIIIFTSTSFGVFRIRCLVVPSTSIRVYYKYL